MNIKRTTNSQLSTTESKKTNKANNQNSNRIIDLRSFGGLSAGKGKNEGNSAGIKKYNLLGTK